MHEATVEIWWNNKIIVKIQIYEIQRINMNDTADHLEILRESQKTLNLRLQESKNEEYVIINI